MAQAFGLDASGAMCGSSAGTAGSITALIRNWIPAKNGKFRSYAPNREHRLVARVSAGGAWCERDEDVDR
jgi:hypothetical protein